MTKDQEEKYADQNDALVEEHTKCMPEQEGSIGVPYADFGKFCAPPAATAPEASLINQQRDHNIAQAVLDDLEAKRKGKSTGNVAQTLEEASISFEALCSRHGLSVKEVYECIVERTTMPTAQDIKEALSINKNYTKTQLRIQYECRELGAMLISKNRKYGNSALDPERVFSSADPIEQLNVRIDDKLSRIKSGQADDTEDTELDLIGYLVLKRVYRALEEKNGG